MPLPSSVQSLLLGQCHTASFSDTRITQTANKLVLKGRLKIRAKIARSAQCAQLPHVFSGGLIFLILLKKLESFSYFNGGQAKMLN